MLILGGGCDRPAPPVDISRTDQPEKVVDGVKLPVFQTAAGQLRYARSGFSDTARKRAALKAVLTLFPDDRMECGHAAIGLAYLHLEPDYRFADTDQIRLVSDALLKIQDTYADLPDVMAKAHWTLGWVYTDLMKKPSTGLSHYWQVVNAYPDIPMNLSPAVPWVNLVSAPVSGTSPVAPDLPRKFWAEVALLEIIRNTTESGMAVQAFDILFRDYFTGPAAGFALKAMLGNPALADHARPHVTAYLQKHKANPYLTREIRLLAAGETP
ncbi:MAG: hypothetical protein MI802_01975 [Desulfobacterales bacterium]|nr:hypothetical protein [Desulfobacterales bacterium]